MGGFLMRDENNIHFCTGSDSPEVILAIVLPIITLSVLLTNNFIYLNAVLISLVSGVLIYLFITLIKNIISFILNSNLDCRIPKLNNSNN